VIPEQDMADVIDIEERLPQKDNLLSVHPLEFRRGPWRSGFAMMCTREESARFEEHRRETLRLKGHEHIAFVPNHFSLDGGYHYTVMGLFRYRAEEALMRRVYRLAGWMECVTRATSPVLRTDLLRRLYKTIQEERQALNIVWRGNIQHFLLPVHPEFRNPNLFLHHIAGAETLKELYDAVETETDILFDILSNHYVFYLPESFLP
jgi:hypothetical protein